MGLLALFPKREIENLVDNCCSLVCSVIFSCLIRLIICVWYYLDMGTGKACIYNHALPTKRFWWKWNVLILTSQGALKFSYFYDVFLPWHKVRGLWFYFCFASMCLLMSHFDVVVAKAMKALPHFDLMLEWSNALSDEEGVIIQAIKFWNHLCVCVCVFWRIEKMIRHLFLSNAFSWWRFCWLLDFVSYLLNEQWLLLTSKRGNRAKLFFITWLWLW